MNADPPAIVLADFDMGGHHRAWLAQFARSFLRLGCRVRCLCPEPEWMVRELGGSPEFSAGLLERPRFAKIRFSRLRSAAEAVARWRAAARAITVRPDLVFFAMFDGLFEFGLTPRLVDALFPYPWSALYFHPGYDRPARKTRLRSDACLRARNCRAVAVLDPGTAENLQSYLASKPVIPFPDFIIPAEPRPPAAWIEQLRARAGQRTIVTAAGALTPRKGITTLLRLALRNDAPEFFYVFAGRFEPEAFSGEERLLWEKAVAHPPENCVLHLGEIASDAEFDQLIAASDLVYAAYHDFRHSSNLVGKAARFRRPILVSRGYYMEESVRRFELGEAVGQGDEEQALAALRVLRTEHPPRDFDGYLRENSIERLEVQLAALLTAVGVA